MRCVFNGKLNVIILIKFLERMKHLFHVSGLLFINNSNFVWLLLYILRLHKIIDN